MKDIISKILEMPEETQSVEFKRLAEKGIVSDIIETIVAMANTDGGVIIIGVDDPEKTKLKGLDRIYGIEEGLEHLDEVGREINKIIPPLSFLWPPRIELVEEINRSVALVFVPKAVDGFRSFNKHVFVRQLKSNKSLTPQEMIDLSYAKGFQRADRELVDVNFDLLKTDVYNNWKMTREIKGDSIEEVLEKVGLARKNTENILKPTRAAVLLFCEYPTNLLDTKCSIRVYQYSGTIEILKETPNLLSTPKTINGPIVQQIKETHEYVLTLLRSGIKIPSGFTNKYIIPERVIKEAITNAVIHRDYHIKRDIEIRIFEDRVEIENTGLFPFNITSSNIGLVRASGYRNDLLVKHLREFPAPPNLDQNEGVRTMISEMRSNNLYPPIYWTYPHLQDAVRVILLNELRASEWEKVSDFLNKNKYITNEEARDITGIDQRDRMTQLLKRWVKQGSLIQIIPPSGYVKGTKYRLPISDELSK